MKSTRLDTGPVQFLYQPSVPYNLPCRLELVDKKWHAHKLLVKLRATLHDRMVDSFKAGTESDFGHNAECAATGVRLAG